VASLVQHAIGATHAGAFDLNAACAGFAYGFAIASDMISSGSHRTVLLIGAETMSRILDWTDRSPCVLFGDGAGAVVLQASESLGGVISTLLGSDGSGAHLLFVPGDGSDSPSSEAAGAGRGRYVKMDGREVYRFAVNVTSRAAQEAVAKARLGLADIDLFIPHQANIRIIQSAARSLNLPQDKVFVNVDRYGNTSSASIPIALCEAIESGRIRQADHLLFVGFGAGLSWGAAVVQWGMPVPPEQQRPRKTAAEDCQGAYAVGAERPPVRPGVAG
jgi:3-oxoacyl-[acyl-carrier-protein] synthase-3